MVGVTGRKNSLVISRVNKFQFKEELKVSLLNLALNIGHLNININIRKDEEKKRERMRRKIEQEQRIIEALERRNNMEIEYDLFHIIR